MKNIMPRPLFKLAAGTIKGLMWLVWLVRLAMLGGLIFVIVSISAYSCRGGKPPEIIDAPFSVVAVIPGNNPITHVYYAVNVLDRGTEYVLLDYWRYDGKNYEQTKGEKHLVKKDWARIGVYRR